MIAKCPHKISIDEDSRIKIFSLNLVELELYCQVVVLKWKFYICTCLVNDSNGGNLNEFLLWTQFSWINYNEISSARGDHNKIQTVNIEIKNKIYRTIGSIRINWPNLLGTTSLYILHSMIALIEELLLMWTLWSFGLSRFFIRNKRYVHRDQKLNIYI